MDSNTSIKTAQDFLRYGKVCIKGITYKHGVNDSSFIKAILPENKIITGKICFIGDLTLTNSDLDSAIHKGFTIGNGKILYWLMTWHKSGNVTVYPASDDKPSRWISGDALINVHFL